VTVTVDLWHVRTDALDERTVEACKRLMTAEETARHGRFVFDRHRHEYLVTRGLACGVLARYVDRAPSELSFQRTEHGRPLLDEHPDLSFNLTNTVELVACAVVRARDIGVDAEPLHRGDEVLRLAKAVFTQAERDGLDVLVGPARRRRAVELWTLKEAYIKARGLGLALPVDHVEVQFADAGPPRLAFFPPVDDVAARWSLSLFELDGHFVSTCVERRREDGPPTIRVHRADLAELLSTR
jgi:4'-phosphopantetheinyl transferase